MTRTLKIQGKVPSIKNHKRIARRADGTPFIMSDPTRKQLLESMILQFKAQWPDEPVESPEIRVTLYVAHRRADRDNMLSAVMDALVGADVLQNDNIKWCNGRMVVEPAIVGDVEGAEVELTW